LTVAYLVALVVVLGAVYGRRGIENATSAQQWGELLAFALLCALVSFAVLEIAKRLLPLRQGIQERYLLQWWFIRTWAVLVPPAESWQELIEALDVQPSASSVFGLPIQLLSAQISNAADIALTEPWRYPLLYHTLTRSAEDVRRLRKLAESQRPGDSPASEDPSDIDDEVLVRTAGQWEAARAGEMTSITVQGLEYLGYTVSSGDSRSFQASQRARATLDSLQVVVGERWRRSVQAASVLIAGLAGLLIQLTQPSPSRWLYIMAAALIGGPLAWTIRDITAVIERWRR
jgi:hypothetical protein